jgi:hypothetical protein
MGVPYSVRTKGSVSNTCDNLTHTHISAIDWHVMFCYRASQLSSYALCGCQATTVVDMDKY